jgi:type IX secretion system PorP/SprF family membrane protein
MKKYKLILLFLFVFCNDFFAQQNVQYSQFMLNDYGLNPAVAGSSKGLMLMVGRRTQWRGFEYAPETNFASITKDFGKKGMRRFWHGAGVYIENDKFGIFNNKAVYGSYAIHLKLSMKYFLSFGLAAGVKEFAVTNTIFDANDPALNTRVPRVLIPDIIPGVYLYSKKVFAGVAVRNVYKNSLQQGSKRIGNGSKLLPNAYITVGRKFVSKGYDFIVVPAIHIQTTFISVPVVNLNCMAYFRKRIGFGLTYRAHDAVSAMIQVRVWQKVVLGFAYDYTVSKLRVANANSTEFMMGISPVMSSENYERPTGAANCPKFEL